MVDMVRVVRDGATKSVLASDLGGSRLRSIPVRVALFGHSTASPGENVKPPNQDAQFTASDTWQNGLVSLITQLSKWSIDSHYPQAYLVANCGIGGQTTNGMLARDGLAASATRRAVTDMLNLNPDVIIHRGNSLNNVLGITTEAALQAALTAGRAQLYELFTRFLSARVPVIVVGDYGYDVAGADLTFVRRYIVAQNAAMRDMCASLPHFYYVDPVGIVANADGSFITPDFALDAIHLTPRSDWMMSKAQADILTRIFGPSSNVRYRGVNRFADPMLLTTVNQSFGSVAGGIVISPTTVDMANAKQEVIDGVKYQTVEVTATAAGAGVRFLLPFDPTAAGLNVAVGDVYGLEYDLLIQPLSGNVVIDEQHRIDIRDSVGNGRVLAERAGAGPYKLDSTFVRHLTHNPLRFGDAAANLTNASSASASVGGLPAGAKVKVGIANVRIVKLA